MDKSANGPCKILFVGILIVLISAACNSKSISTPLSSPTVSTPATITLIPPSSTPIPATSAAIPPTLTPTAPPIPKPIDYLLSANESFLPTLKDKYAQEMLDYPQFTFECDVNGNYSYYIKWWSAAGFELDETVTIAKQPWTKIPEDGFPVSMYFSDKEPTAIESAPVGGISQAYEYKSNPSETGWVPKVRFVFIKGNSFVNIYAKGFSVDDIVNLGKLIELQLPEVISEAPVISFPDQLDKEAFAKYFKEVVIGTYKQDSGVDPTNVFSSEQFPVWGFARGDDTSIWDFEVSFDTPRWETAVYDLQAKRYICRHAAIWRGYVDFKPICILHPLTTGQYEFRLAMKGVLVFSTPFEIR